VWNTRTKLLDPNAGVFIVAHRGCHNPDPMHGTKAAPENSMAALQNCLVLGVDMMETDIRRSKDGKLVIIHDETVDRTTTGTGRVSQLRLAQLQALRLRQNFGGATSPTPTDQHVLSLDEMLAAARDRIMLNLDIKEAIYPEVVAAVQRAGMTEQVLIKSPVNAVEPPLADQAPYDQVLYIPIIRGTGGTTPGTLATILAAQAGGRHAIVAVEVDHLDGRQFAALGDATRRARIRLWANTLTSVGAVSVLGVGGDKDALRDPTTWRKLLSGGVSVIQTDEPATLARYLQAQGIH